MTDQASQHRAQQRAMWSLASPAWLPDPHAPIAPPDPITERLVALTRLRPGGRALDFGCGGGNATFVLAQVAGESGMVLGLDIVPEMVDGVRVRAESLGITQVATRLITSDVDLGIQPATFDAVTCRFSLMFPPDPIATLRCLRAALKPGGRIAVSTWGGLERCTFLSIPLGIALRHVELSQAALDEITLPCTRFPSDQALHDALTAAGFVNVQTETAISAREAPTATAYWDTIIPISAPLLALFNRLPEATRQAIRDDIVSTLDAMFPGGPVRLGGDACLGAATAP